MRKLILILLSTYQFLAVASPQAVDTIFHGVDIQWTFWEPVNGRETGVLTVPGSAAILDNVLTLTRLAKDSPRAKSILTKDYHFEIERRDPKWNGEFHGTYAFRAHGMAELSGPAGHEILSEVLEVFPADQQQVIPHNHEVKGADASLDQLVLEPFDLAHVASWITSPNVQLILHKNGPQSYDFAQNPRARAIVDQIAPKHVYVYGVATDFCVVAAAMSYRSWGYEVSVVTDAVAGIFPHKIAQEMQTMRDAGVHFVTTAEVVAAYQDSECEKALTQER